MSDTENKKPKMVNITINIADIYDKNIQKLIAMKVVPSRSEAIRIALRDYLRKEFENLELLGFYNDEFKENK
ncbi:MAG: ribbon-helix-helix domain-containing protein [Candidatus Hodarchaeota archaeon]